MPVRVFHFRRILEFQGAIPDRGFWGRLICAGNEADFFFYKLKMQDCGGIESALDVHQSMLRCWSNIKTVEVEVSFFF